VGVDVLVVELHKAATGLFDKFGRAQLLGERAFHKAFNSVTYHHTILFVGVGRKTLGFEDVVATDGQIANGIEECAVEVENCEFVLFHSGAKVRKNLKKSLIKWLER
jgi:hypothetical protein